MDPQRRHFHVLNGPNLGLLGQREPHIYGTRTLADVEALCRSIAARHDADLTFRQTDAEHQMVAWLHDARRCAGIVINPGAHCYYSVAILDAMRSCECPIVEVHISNIHRREEPWRSKSILTAAATGGITGLGVDGYGLALEYLAQRSPAA